MPKEPAWDIYESALLLDTCFRVERGEISRKAAIKELSEKLRRKAERNGYLFDETYRNENGMSRQLACMEDVITQRGRLHASKKFIDIARIYQEEPENYAQILRTAKRMVAKPFCAESEHG